MPTYQSLYQLTLTCSRTSASRPHGLYILSYVTMLHTWRRRGRVPSHSPRAVKLQIPQRVSIGCPHHSSGEAAHACESDGPSHVGPPHYASNWGGHSPRNVPRDGPPSSHDLRPLASRACPFCLGCLGYPTATCGGTTRCRQLVAMLARRRHRHSHRRLGAERHASIRPTRRSSYAPPRPS